MTITVNPDFSVVIETDARICHLPNYHPETQFPWASAEHAQAFAERIQADNRYMISKADLVVSSGENMVSPPRFMLRLTPTERVAIRAAALTDPIIADWLAILDDPRLTEMDLNAQATADGLDYLVAQGLLVQARVVEILA